MITRNKGGTVLVLIHTDGRLVSSGDMITRLDEPTARRIVIGSSDFSDLYLAGHAVDRKGNVFKEPDGDFVGYTLLPRDYGLEWREL